MTFLPTRPLGKTGLEVSVMGLGGAWLGRTDDGGYDDSLAVATVYRALERGINLIDTSPAYGDSERYVGRALESWRRAGGRREAVVLCTKTGTRGRVHDYSGVHTRDSVQRSLELLKTDWLDLVHIHDPTDLEQALAPGGAVEVLEAFKAEGVVRAIGLGVRSHALHQQFIASGRADVVLTYWDFNLLDQSAADGVLAPAAAKGVGVINAMALVYGLLAGENPQTILSRRPTLATPVQAQRAHALWRWACERQVPLLAVALQFCARERRIASTLVGASRPDEVDADVDALLHPLPASVWQELQERFELPVGEMVHDQPDKPRL